MTRQPPSEREALLLKAALHPNADTAVASWLDWSSRIALEEAPYPELRLLTAAYDNVTRLAPSFRFPDKVKGKARATFMANHLLAGGVMPTLKEMSERCPILIAKGLGICVRFNAWASRTMGDADIHVPYASLTTACEVLARMGWVPYYGLTYDTLLHRVSLRRESWNFSKGNSQFDLHWGIAPGRVNEALSRDMWATAERRPCLGLPVLLHSPEFALATSLEHGYKRGTHADGLQTLVDATMLLPACKAERLLPLIARLALRQGFAKLLATLREAGQTAIADTWQAVSRTDTVRNNSDNDGILAPANVRDGRRLEESLLSRPAVYRLWEGLGRKASLERMLLRTLGPMSKPTAWSPQCEFDYDLCDARVMDRIGGPGWGWPEGKTCFWSDRGDARLLIPLQKLGNHLLLFRIAESRVSSANVSVHVFANGMFITTMEFKEESQTSQYSFFVPKRALFGPWLELSFRPQAFSGDRQPDLEGFVMLRSVPARRLQVFDANWFFSAQCTPELNLRILKGQEPEAGKFLRIKAKIEASPHHGHGELPQGFDPYVYVLSHADLFEAEVEPFDHYLQFGRREKRAWR